MIANPDKFHAIILNKRKSDNSINITIGNKTILSEKVVKLLGVNIDNGLNFNLHIDEVCKKASSQLNALFRLKNSFPYEVKRTLVNTFINSNFYYFPLIWHFAPSKVEKIHKRALHFLEDNSNVSSYSVSDEQNYMTTIRLKNLCDRPVRKPNLKYLEVKRVKTFTFGSKSFSSIGPRVWNKLPHEVKNCQNLTDFKKLIKYINI